MELNSAQVLQLLRDNLYGNKDKMVIDRDTKLSMFNCVKDLTNRAIRFECELATARDDRYREGLRHSKTITEFRNFVRGQACACEERCILKGDGSDMHCGWVAQQLMAKYE